jgi:capsular polysaccharide biosynthesis protein
MELTETARRLAAHWRLILVFLLVGIGAAALLHGGGGDKYTASSRLVLDTEDPKSRAESMAIADTAKAIATSPSQVRAALAATHATGRDPLEVANERVSVHALGTSAIVQISVTDRSRYVAAALANALADGIIRTRLKVNTAEVEQVLTRLDTRIEKLNLRIAKIDANIDELDASISSGGNAVKLGPQRATAERLRDFLVQQRAVLEAQRVSLLSTSALRPKPEIISRATPPAHADSSRWVPYLLLGALLGLVLGVGAASLVETFRPTLVGGDSLAREFDTPFLGELLRKPDGGGFGHDLDVVAQRLRFAADVAGVDTVALVAIRRDVDLSRMAEMLEAAAPATAPALPDAAAAVAIRGGAFADQQPYERPRENGLRITPFDAQSPVDRRTGFVLVLPKRVKKSELVDVRHLLSVTPSPLLGSITYAAMRARRRLEGSVAGAASQA